MNQKGKDLMNFELVRRMALVLGAVTFLMSVALFHSAPVFASARSGGHITPQFGTCRLTDAVQIAAASDVIGSTTLHVILYDNEDAQTGMACSYTASADVNAGPSGTLTVFIGNFCVQQSIQANTNSTTSNGSGASVSTTDPGGTANPKWQAWASFSGNGAFARTGCAS